MTSLKRFSSFLIIFVSNNSHAAEIQKMSFPELLKKATDNTLDLKRGQNSVIQAETSRKVLDLKDDLRLNVTGSISPKYSADTATANIVNGKSIPNMPFTDKYLAGKNLSLTETVAAQATKNLYDFGRSDADKNKADLQIKEKSQELSEVVEQLKWKVGRIYLGVLTTESLLKRTQEQLDNARKKQQEALDQYKKGLHPEYDLARANTDFGRASLTFKNAKADYEVAVNQLQLLLATDTHNRNRITTLIMPKGNIEKSVMTWRQLIQSWTTLLPTAASSTRNANKELLRADLSVINAKYKPLITAGATLSLLDTTKLSGFDSNSFQPSLSGQVGFSWDIPWNGASKYEELMVLQKIDDFNIQDSLEQKNREELLNTTTLAIEKSFEQINTINEQRVLIENLMQLTKKRYDTGKASATDLSAIDAEFISIRLDEVRANNTLANSILSLAQTIGVPNLETIFE